MPFNITTGEDNYNTTLFTARPAGVPRNFGRGPGKPSTSMVPHKTWGFGPEKGAGGSVRSSRDSGPAAEPALQCAAEPRPFHPTISGASTVMTVGTSGHNILNHTNQAQIHR